MPQLTAVAPGGSTCPERIVFRPFGESNQHCSGSCGPEPVRQFDLRRLAKSEITLGFRTWAITSTRLRTRGHVFDVLRSELSTATWSDISNNLPDLPVTDLVRDDVTGDLYAASEFGVMRLANAATTTWTVAGSGLPMVEVPGLTIVPSARLLYAATHGRSAWLLQLP